MRVIEAGPLPAGWTGKNNAVTAGASAARGEWLLFTDADTIHLPGSLARSLEEAKRHDAALLSYSPEQIVKSFWEKAIMPVIFAELAASYPPVASQRSQFSRGRRQRPIHPDHARSLRRRRRTRRHRRKSARRRSSGPRRKTSGRKIFFRYAADAVRTRMYRSFAQLREGWTKNLALLFPAPARLPRCERIEFVADRQPAGAIAVICRSAQTAGNPPLVAGVLGVILYMFFLKRIRRAHFSWDANLLAFFGLPCSHISAALEERARETATVAWKGRTILSKKGSCTGH